MRTRDIAVATAAVGAAWLGLPAVAQAAAPAPTALTLSASASTIRYGQTITISGTDVVAGSSTPVAGQRIDIAAGPASSSVTGEWTATTDSEGRFAVRVSAGLDGSGAMVDGINAGSVANATDGAAVVHIAANVVAVPVKVALKWDPEVPAYGKSFKFYGGVSYAEAGRQHPLPGGVVVIGGLGCFGGQDGSCDVFPPAYRARIRANGSFELSPKAGFPLQFGASATSPNGYDGWFSQASPIFTVVTGHLPTGDFMVARRTVDGDAGISACVSLAGDPTLNVVYPPALPPLPAAEVQIAERKAGPWHTLVSHKVARNSPQWGCYHTVLKPPPGRLFYRVANPATAGARGFLAGHSAAIREDMTRPGTSAVTDLRVGPRRAKPGQRITIEGGITITGGYSDGNYPGWGTADVLYRPEGSARWSVKARERLSGDLGFIFHVALPRSGEIEVRYNGTLYVFGCHTREVRITVG